MRPAGSDRRPRRQECAATREWGSRGPRSDVALKRKIRNTIALLNEETNKPGYDIYVEAGVALNAQHERAHAALGDGADQLSAQEWMCRAFFDVRTFGAVMTTGKKDKRAGRVQGPFQLAFSRSVDPVTPWSTASRASPPPGRKTSTPEESFWRAFTLMFDHDRAAARGEFNLRGLYVFSHDDTYHKAPARQIMDRVAVKGPGDATARTFSDYQVDVAEADLPGG